MKPRRILLFSLGVLAAVVAMVLLFGRAPGLTRVCPAIGYAYVGDVELAFSMQPASVSACFGEECIPASVEQGPDGKWLVPEPLLHRTGAQVPGTLV
jgi:hypothetical protein